MQNEIYAIVIHVYMDYWKDDILLHLYLPKVQLFWRVFFPSTNWRSSHDKVFVCNIIEVVDVQDPIILPFFD
jgi:hypothetical protein